MHHADMLFRWRWRHFHPHTRALIDTYDFIIAHIDAGGQLDQYSTRLYADLRVIKAAKTLIPLRLSIVLRDII